MLCHDCAGKCHLFNPLHRIEVCICSLRPSSFSQLILVKEWTGSRWAKTSLAKKLGLVVQIGHPGISCPANDEGTPVHDLTVIACNGIHNVRVRWCNCSKSLGFGHKHCVQLLRTRLFPASYSKPQTVVTFDCLKSFHGLTVQGKLTGFEFYQSVVNLTDNAGLDPPPVSTILYSIQSHILTRQ